MPANTTNNLAELRAGVDIGGTFTDVLLYDGSMNEWALEDLPVVR